MVTRTFNEACYILANFSDSNNPIFTSQEEVQNFKERVKAKLGDLVKILAWSFQTDQYQILVYIKSRSCFEAFYKEKHKSSDLKSEEIPESYLILSQEMANIMSGYAKWFNFRHERFGSLFGRRYTKILLETDQEVKEAIDNMNKGVKLWDFKKLWSFVWNFLKEKAIDLGILDTSKGMYDDGGVQQYCWFPGFLRYSEWDLRGRYVAPAFSTIS